MVLVRQATATATSIVGSKGRSKCGCRAINSLALSVHFRQPDFGMRKYEILSRASAFLISTEDPSSEASGLSRHVKKEMNWLDFCPKTHDNRPLAHVVAASHVLSPWLFPNYYSHDWLSHVRQQHVAYSLDVITNHHTDNNATLARFACDQNPIHHPDGMDLAIIHLTNEETALQSLKKLGLEPLHLTTDTHHIFERGDEVLFDGFEVTEGVATHNNSAQTDNGNDKPVKESDDDTRIFIPYTATGELIFASSNRILASTSKPLPEGLCGGPVIIDNNNNNKNKTVCGIVEGIVPTNHQDERIAGAASFLPFQKIREFIIDHVEKVMLEKILPNDLFHKVVEFKNRITTINDTIPLNGNTKNDITSSSSSIGQTGDMVDYMDKIYDQMKFDISKAYSLEQVETILNMAEQEQQTVLNVLQTVKDTKDEKLLPQ